MKGLFRKWTATVSALVMLALVPVAATPVSADDETQAQTAMTLSTRGRTTAQSDDIIELSINVERLQKTGWEAMELCLSYPTDQLEFVDYFPGKALGNVFPVVNVDIFPVRVEVISARPQTANGELYRFLFRVKSGVADGQSLNLSVNIEQFIRTEPDGQGSVKSVDVIKPQTLSKEIAVRPPELMKLQMTRKPHKLNYRIGTPLDLSDMVVVATYSNGAIEQVPTDQLDVSGFDSTKIGAKELTVAYKGWVLSPFTIKVWDILYGDVNGDDEVDSLDALAILEHEVYLEQLNQEVLPAADVNGDGKVDSLDALEILEYEVGLIPELTIEKRA